MEKNNREAKKLAAIGGVLACLAGEAARYPREAAAAESKKAQAVSAHQGPSPWALYGRQRIMQMRSLLQRRAYRR
jgi:hypothetical protein